MKNIIEFCSASRPAILLLVVFSICQAAKEVTSHSVLGWPDIPVPTFAEVGIKIALTLSLGMIAALLFSLVAVATGVFLLLQRQLAKTILGLFAAASAGERAENSSAAQAQKPCHVEHANTRCG